MTEEDFKVQHLETADDVEQHLELMRQVFGQDSGVDTLVKKWIDHHPRMTLKDFFVIKHEGKIVASLNLIPSVWSIGGFQLKVAELGCVATLPQFRRLNLQKRLMDEYHKEVSRRECDLSAIEGIPYFYRQFGYEYALPLGEMITISISKIPSYTSKHRIRPFTISDTEKVKQLLAKTKQKFYVHTIRDAEIWRMQIDTSMAAEYRFEAYVVEEKGEVIAYFRISENQKEKKLFLREITDVDQVVAKSILCFFKDYGKNCRLETLVAAISFSEPFTAHLIAIGGVKQEPYAWQLYVPDHVKILRKMKRIFEKRLASSTYCHITESLNFNLYRYTLQIETKDGRIADISRSEVNEDRTIRFNPHAFVQLLVGYRSLEELQLIYPDVLVHPSHRHLVNVLFPKMRSFIHVEY